MSNYFKIEEASKYNNILEKSIKNNIKVFIKFGANWCGPCRKIEPFFKNISKKYPKCNFVSIEINKRTKPIAIMAKVKSIPDFGVIFKNKYTKILVGSSESKLQSAISKYAK